MAMTQQCRFGTIRIAIVVLALTVTGCRTYGGFGAKEANMEAIQRANEAFEQDLAVALQYAQQLESAAATDPLAAGQFERFQSVVLAHETILEDHKALADRLSTGSNKYRTVARTLGAIIAEQEMIRNRYEGLLPGAEPENPRVLGIWDQLTDARYVVAPPFYERQFEQARVLASPQEFGASGRPGSAGDSLGNAAPFPDAGTATESPAPADSAAQ